VLSVLGMLLPTSCATRLSKGENCALTLKMESTLSKKETIED
jgi:hypothetical protein